MEGLIPLLLRAMKKQSPQNAYRCLSENSTGRSYHLLLAGDPAEGSSHGRTSSDFQQPAPVDYLFGSENMNRAKSFAVRSPAASPSNAGNELRLGGFTSAAAHCQVSAQN